MKRAGLDIGSTTIKCVVIGEDNKILFSSYERHMAHIQETASRLLSEVASRFGNEKMLLSVSGSAGMGIAESLGLPFAQEVYAAGSAVKKLIPVPMPLSNSGERMRRYSSSAAVQRSE